MSATHSTRANQLFLSLSDAELNLANQENSFKSCHHSRYQEEQIQSAKVFLQPFQINYNGQSLENSSCFLNTHFVPKTCTMNVRMQNDNKTSRVWLRDLKWITTLADLVENMMKILAEFARLCVLSMKPGANGLQENVRFMLIQFETKMVLEFSEH